MNCPLCQKPFEPWMTLPADWRRPKDTASYRLFWCARCAFGQVGPRPDPLTVAAFYAIDDYYTHETSKSNGRSKLSFAQRLKTHLAWRADKSVELDGSWIQNRLAAPGKDVIDLGCGSGDLLCKLRDAGHFVMGVEPDPAARKVAQHKGLN